MLMITSSPTPDSLSTAKPVDPTRQTDGHDATRASPAATWRPSYHVAAPSRRWRSVRERLPSLARPLPIA
jgi:hypothetical protein